MRDRGLAERVGLVVIRVTRQESGFGGYIRFIEKAIKGAKVQARYIGRSAVTWSRGLFGCVLTGGGRGSGEVRVIDGRTCLAIFKTRKSN